MSPWQMLLSLTTVPEFSEAENVPEGYLCTVTAGAAKVALQPAPVPITTDTELPSARLVGLNVLEAPDNAVLPFVVNV